MVINELNLFPNGRSQFVELKKICNIHFKPKQFPVNMKFYKLLVVTHDGYLITACDLEGKATPSSKGGDIFFVLSTETNSDGNMNIGNCHFAADASGTTTKHLPIGDIAPVGIALVYSPSKDSIKDLDLVMERPNTFGKTKIDARAEKKIRENLQDLVIVTSSSPYTYCKYFERFFSGYGSSSNSVLRDWAQLDASWDRSLSRCLPNDGLPVQSHFHPFQSSLFTYAPPSKGKENICHESTRFVVEEYQPRRKVPRTDFTEAFQCFITTEDKAIETSNMITSPSAYNNMLRKLIESFQSSRSSSTSKVRETSEATLTETVDIFADHSGIFLVRFLRRFCFLGYLKVNCKSAKDYL